MNTKHFCATTLLGGLLATGCASTPSEPVSAAGPDTRQAEFAALVQEATAALDRVDAEGFEWRDSRKMLKEAEEAAKAGDYAKAMKLAGEAKFQGEAAHAQYLANQNAGPHL